MPAGYETVRTLIATDDEDFAQSMKACLEMETKIPMVQQQLYFGDQELRDGYDAAHHGIKDGDIINMVLVPNAPGPVEAAAAEAMEITDLLGPTVRIRQGFKERSRDTTTGFRNQWWCRGCAP